MGLTVRDITRIALCASLMCITSLLTIPVPFTPIVITLQTFMLNIIALLLTPKQAFLSSLVYIIIGLLGIPVFAGGTCGIQKLISITGGFIIAFVFAAPLISLFKGKSIQRYLISTLCIGMPVIYLIGAVHLCIISGTGFVTALQTAVIPFIIPDAAKCVAAAIIAYYVNKILKRENVH